MFCLEKFYDDAERGNAIDVNEVVEYINKFETVIIWGAGNLGTALGKYFVENQIQFDGYWDQKYEMIQERNGKKVYPSFGELPAHDKSNTLIICGIVNGTRSHNGQCEKLMKAGYAHSILGMSLYEGIVCQMRKGMVLDIKQCTGTSVCNFNTCKKYMNLMDDSNRKKKNIIHVLEFIVSRTCTLECKECGQQVGRIKHEFPEKYIVYPLERIKKDIDIMMDNVDKVGTFSIIGGEPFSHPQLDEIIQHCLTKKNVAIISVTTNGICNMTEEMLQHMKNPRVKINFSDYTEALSENQKQLFHKNVALVKKCGLNCNVGVPVWAAVKDIVEANPEIEEQHYMQEKHECPFGPSISNGRFFACPVTEQYYQLEEVDVSKDSFLLSETDDIGDKIYEMLNRPYYETCKHRCGNKLVGEQVQPGVQV